MPIKIKTPAFQLLILFILHFKQKFSIQEVLEVL